MATISVSANLLAANKTEQITSDTIALSATKVYLCRQDCQAVYFTAVKRIFVVTDHNSNKCGSFMLTKNQNHQFIMNTVTIIVKITFN